MKTFAETTLHLRMIKKLTRLSTQTVLFTLLFYLNPLSADAQKAFLRIVSPAKNEVKTNSLKQFITGVTCKDCFITINDTEVRVWPTGAFAVQINLTGRDSVVRLTATDKNGFKPHKALFTLISCPKKKKRLQVTLLLTGA